MKILNRVGGAFLLLVLGMAAILGFQSPTGRQVWDAMWAAGSAALGWAGDQIQRLSGTSVAGNAPAAIAIAAVGVIVVLALLKKPISVRAFTAMVLVAALGAVVLYNPQVVQSL